METLSLLPALVIVYPLVLHDFMHGSLTAVVEAPAPNFSTDLPGFHALNLLISWYNPAAPPCSIWFGLALRLLLEIAY